MYGIARNSVTSEDLEGNKAWENEGFCIRETGLGKENVRLWTPCMVAFLACDLASVRCIVTLLRLCVAIEFETRSYS